MLWDTEGLNPTISSACLDLIKAVGSVIEKAWKRGKQRCIYCTVRQSVNYMSHFGLCISEGSPTLSPVW